MVMIFLFFPLFFFIFAQLLSVSNAFLRIIKMQLTFLVSRISLQVFDFSACIGVHRRLTAFFKVYTKKPGRSQSLASRF